MIHVCGDFTTFTEEKFIISSIAHCSFKLSMIAETQIAVETTIMDIQLTVKIICR
jgi:hypothetical protein